MKHTRFLGGSPLKDALLLALLITIVCGGMMAAFHRKYRAAADEPQGEIARSVAQLIALEVPPQDIVANVSQTDLRASPAAWVVIYDAQAAPVASTALLDNAVPHIPEGVFTFAKKMGEHQVTWQPEKGLRQAIVVVPVGDDYFVVSGRSLKETESALGQSFKKIIVAWAAGMVLIAIWYTTVVQRSRRRA